MDISLFDFSLPDELVATRPLAQRDGSRLLHQTPSKTIHDRSFTDFPNLLKSSDVLVFNNTKVIPAQLTGKRGEASIRVTLHKREGDGIWCAFAKPAKKLTPNDVIHFSDTFSCIVAEKYNNGEVLLTFNKQGEEFDSSLHTHGRMPLPPYMKRDANTHDNSTYQTVYAQEAGAVAAPTAGLHFTTDILKALSDKNIEQHHVTLHVGAGTFLPVKVDNINDHVMHSEWCTVSPETAQAINTAKAEGRRVIAIGTTSLRTLESMTNDEGQLMSGNMNTDIFITPGYRFKMVDGMLTNFHLPRSTLFMLVCAFMGRDVMHEAYQHAIARKYRFYSYGDACFLERNI